MKKEWIVAFAAACAIALAGCKVVSEPEPIAVQSVTLNTTTLTLTIDDDWTRTLVATVYPYNADNRTVTWYSSNPEVADVDYWGGVVTAHSEGTTTISAYAGSRMASCEVTVKRKVVAVNYVTLNETTITLEQNARHILTATAHPDDADDKTATWSSSNPEVARVYSDGVSDGMIVAIGPGTAIITAQVGDKTATCEVTVNETLIEQPDNPVAVEVESITLNTSTLILEPNTTSELTATVTPDDADDKMVTWRTSDYWVATVDYDGIVTAHNEGTATITAQVGDKTATCEITVKHIANPVTGVMLDKETLTLTRSESGELTATLTPSNADYTSVTWTSSDLEVAEVSEWGNTCHVRAVKMGTATITATTEEGGFTAKCEVTVLPLILIESITFVSSTLFLECNETGDVGCKIMPFNTDDPTLIWSSSDETIATVATCGMVTAHKAGKATITATARAGGKTATYDVIVHKHSYSEGKCTVCGVNPTMKDGWIDKNGVLTSYSGSETKVIIPDGVAGIGEYAFHNAQGKLTSVTIPDSVTSIGYDAFSSCHDLTNVTIGKGVKSIGSGAFWYCTSLTDITIPDSVTSIGNGAFSNCTSLKSVTIPDSVTSIGDNMFRECTSIENVTIGNGVKSIGDSTFNGCTNLKSVTIGNNVTSIGSNAFYGCTSLTSVTIPSSVTSIGNSAFHNCRNLTTVTYGGTLADWCSISWNDNVAPLNHSANPLSNEKAVLYIGGSAVKDAVIPNGATEIKYHAFYGCTSIESVTIPGSVTSIEEYAFYKCTGLKKVTINNGVTSIGDNMFRECTSLTDVTIPGSVKSIGWRAFYECPSLTSIKIPEGVTNIGSEAFFNCYNLTSVAIPGSVKSIEERAFRGCYNLKTVTYDTTTGNEWKNIEIGNYAFPDGCLITGSKGDSWTWNFNGWI